MWIILEYAAWAAAVGILLWMVSDAVRVNRQFDEDTLLSSKEGVDELLEHDEASGSARGGQ